MRFYVNTNYYFIYKINYVFQFLVYPRCVYNNVGAMDASCSFSGMAVVATVVLRLPAKRTTSACTICTNSS